jgi:hypothetical protein
MGRCKKKKKKVGCLSATPPLPVLLYRLWYRRTIVLSSSALQYYWLITQGGAREMQKRPLVVACHKAYKISTSNSEFPWRLLAKYANDCT